MCCFSGFLETVYVNQYTCFTRLLSWLFYILTHRSVANYQPSEMSLSRISHAKMVGFSLLYCSIFDTTAGVATFGLLPPIKPGGLNVPAKK